MVKVSATPLTGVLVLEPEVFEDERGYFFESYNEKAFAQATGIAPRFVQDNCSRSMMGVVRGLHYQVEPHAQAKLVRCTSGSIWDVAVDIRRSSSTFGRWFGLELSASNKRQLWIPEGMAHGFMALTEDAEVMYKTTDYYAPESDRVIRWDDPDIGIEWPLDGPPILSRKDREAPLLQEADIFP